LHDFVEIPRDINILITYPHKGSAPRDAEMKPERVDFSLMNWAMNDFMAAYRDGKKAHPISKSLIEKNLAIIMRRPIFDSPPANFHLNGCCLPAVRKLYVAVDGTYSMCERIPISPNLGNVYSGLDLDLIREVYINKYDSISLPECSKCWAIQLCKVCYMHSFRDGKLDAEEKSRSCKLVKLSLVEDLRFYCRLLEINPSGLNYLGDWIFE
jgi:uncharacterized protein